MRSEKTTKVCHCCKGIGKVDGGNAKRIKRELLEIESERNQALSSIKEKDREKLKEIRKVTNDEFNKKIKSKENEVTNYSGNCFYCQGTGFRKINY